MFISSAFAAAEATAVQGAASGTNMIVQLVLIMAVFYIFLIRPQQKKLKQHEQLLQSIKNGDKIITGGGIVAKVIDAKDPFELSVEIAEGVKIKIYRSTVRDVLTDDDKKEKNAVKTVNKSANNKKSKNKL